MLISPLLGSGLPATVPSKNALFFESAQDAIFSRKWCQMGCPSRPQNPQKCKKIMKSPPPSAFREATLRRPWKKHEKVIKFMHIREGLYAIRTRLCSRNTLFPFPTFPQKCIEKTSKMFPCGYLLGSFGHLNASTCRFLGVSGAA